ncbi:MAG: hypothetical protein L0227_10455 [Chloroflexi bacterium]|nr:hypothetical protein [Chloroflexota bacterium]
MPIAAIIAALFVATGNPSTRRFQTLVEGRIEHAESGGIGPAVDFGAVGATVGGVVGGVVGARVGATVGPWLGTADGPLVGIPLGPAVGGSVCGPTEEDDVGPSVEAEPPGDVAPGGAPSEALATASCPGEPPSEAVEPPFAGAGTGPGRASATTMAQMAMSGKPNQASRLPRMRISPA